jgi:hypothetical protein
MKTQIATLILIILSSIAYTQNYNKLLRINTYWDDHFISYPNIGCYNYAHRKYIDNQDTIIDGHTYIIIKAYPFHSQNPLFCPPFTIDTISYPTYYYLREDTIAKKVYINFNEGDQILYDFSLLPGDTLHSTYTGYGTELILDTIVNISLLNGEIRKKFVFENYMPNSSYYIESIGGSNGLCEPIVSFEWDGGFFCVKENSINLWGDDCEFWFVDVSKNDLHDVNIYPNPASTNITIETSSHGRVSILNLSGQKLLHLGITEPKARIDISSLPNGVYIVKLVGEKGVQVSKFVKQ